MYSFCKKKYQGGWSSQILNEKLIQSEKDDRGRWYVGYLATVRVKLLNGASHEDCGSGEGINESKIKAHEKALKSAVTDAMKRAARHFGERLGNALYIKGNGIRTAPRTNRDALVELERRDATNLFGDQVALRGKSNDDQSSTEDENKFVAAAIAAATNNEAIRTAASATLTSAAAGAATSGNLSFVHQKSNSNNNNNNANRSIVNSLLCPKPPQNPSPIISRGTLVQQHPQLISVPGNHLLSIHPQQKFVQHQTMAPPPNRPMYNPSNNTGKTTCHISNYSQQQQVATNVSTDTMKRALDEGDESNIVKRQKLNPYCTNKQRLTV
jgi:DNA recombination protein Rad52